MKKKKTITICSSAAFYKQVIEVKKILERAGFKVTVPLTAGKMERAKDFNVERVKTWYKNPADYKRKTFLTKHHFNKVVKGDAVLVLNYEKNGRPGYIGGAVLSEMGLALHYNKPIYVLNPPDPTSILIEEIFGFLPIFLEGDLSRIQL